MVMTTSAARTTSSVSGLGDSSVTSMPSSLMTSITAGSMRSSGCDPAERRRSNLPRADASARLPSDCAPRCARTRRAPRAWSSRRVPRLVRGRAGARARTGRRAGAGSSGDRSVSELIAGLLNESARSFRARTRPGTPQRARRSSPPAGAASVDPDRRGARPPPQREPAQRLIIDKRDFNR
jgi:hypothetical protein